MTKIFKENSLAKKFESVPLCHPTIVRRIIDINEHLCNKLKSMIEKMQFIIFFVWTTVQIYAISVNFVFLSEQYKMTL